jgi:hypothetical protein
MIEKITARKDQLICAQTVDEKRRTNPHISPKFQPYLRANNNAAAFVSELSYIANQIQLHYFPFPAKKISGSMGSSFAKNTSIFNIQNYPSLYPETTHRNATKPCILFPPSRQ